VDQIIDFSNESLLKLKKKERLVMNKILILGLFLYFGLTGSEREVRNLIRRQDDQTLGFMFAMVAIGAHGLFKNSEQVCSPENPYCWKVLAPMLVVPVMGGCLLYKKIWPMKVRV
jgi:hypothetical protein